MIAIVTRTSNRPRYFDRCRRSVRKQGSIVSSHHVISDNPNDLSYLQDHGISIHQVDVTSLRKSYQEPAPATATPPLLSIHNLYFNQVYSHIEQDWVYHLDDDNYLINGAFNGLETVLNSDAELIILRIAHFTGKLPRDNDFRVKRIRLAGIDTGCFLVRTELMKRTKWDGWKCGDFRVVDKLNRLSKKTVWLDRTVMKMDQQNLGNKNDLG